MSKKCALTGKTVTTGNNVSHAINKTRRKFFPNLQRVSIVSNSLSQIISLKVSTRALRIIEIKGGFDDWLFSTKNSRLTHKARLLKKRIQRVQKSS